MFTRPVIAAQNPQLVSNLALAIGSSYLDLLFYKSSHLTNFRKSIDSVFRKHQFIVDLYVKHTPTSRHQLRFDTGQLFDLIGHTDRLRKVVSGGAIMYQYFQC